MHTRRELLILRHAKSAWDTDAPSDFHRPLAKRGRRDAPRMGVWLAEQALVPQLIVSSSAERARQTAVAAAEAMGYAVDDIAFDDRLYHCDVREALRVLADHARSPQRVMIVGHNPGFEDLVLHLAGGHVGTSANAKVLPTASIAHLRLPADWSALGSGDGDLVQIARPKEI